MVAQEKSTIAIVTDDEVKAVEIITLSAQAASNGNDVTLFFIHKGIDLLRNSDNTFLYELIQLAKRQGVRVIACSTLIDDSDDSELGKKDFFEGTEFARIEDYILTAEQARVNLVM